MWGMGACSFLAPELQSLLKTSPAWHLKSAALLLLLFLQPFPAVPRAPPQPSTASPDQEHLLQREVEMSGWVPPEPRFLPCGLYAGTGIAVIIACPVPAPSSCLLSSCCALSRGLPELKLGHVAHVPLHGAI